MLFCINLHSSIGCGTEPCTQGVWSSIRLIVRFGCQYEMISTGILLSGACCEKVWKWVHIFSQEYIETKWLPYFSGLSLEYVICLTNQQRFSKVCTLIDKDICHLCGWNVVDSQGTAEWVGNKFWPLCWPILPLIRIKTMLNHCQFVFLPQYWH